MKPMCVFTCRRNRRKVKASESLSSTTAVTSAGSCNITTNLDDILDDIYVPDKSGDHAYAKVKILLYNRRHYFIDVLLNSQLFSMDQNTTPLIAYEAYVF